MSNSEPQRNQSPTPVPDVKNAGDMNAPPNGLRTWENNVPSEASHNNPSRLANYVIKYAKKK